MWVHDAAAWYGIFVCNILYYMEYSYDYTEVPAGYPTFSIACLIYSTSHLGILMQYTLGYIDAAAVRSPKDTLRTTCIHVPGSVDT